MPKGISEENQNLKKEHPSEATLRHQLQQQRPGGKVSIENERPGDSCRGPQWCMAHPLNRIKKQTMCHILHGHS